MAEKGGRARCQAIGSGLKDGDKIADIGQRKQDIVAEYVQRRAQAPDNGTAMFRGLSHPGCDRDRIVPPDGLTKIARGGELVMQPPVDDEKGPPSRLLTIDYSRDVDAAFADDVAAKLEDNPRIGKPRTDPLSHEIRQIVPDRRKIDRLVLLEIGNAEAAPDIEVLHGPGRQVGKRQQQVDGLALRLDEDLGAQVLRSGENVVSRGPRGLRLRALIASEGTSSASMPNCCGPPPIRMPDPLTWKSGLTRIAILGRIPSRLPASTMRAASVREFHFDRHACRHCLAELRRRLARPSETDARRRHGGVERGLHFKSGRDVEGIDEARQMLNDRGHRIGLDRVAQLHVRGQGARSKLCTRKVRSRLS